MELRTLNCPSCGGELHLPTNLSIAHCIYCGKQVILPDTRATHERKSVERYMELCAVALRAGNYEEAFQRASQVLELDPRNVDAWIRRAFAAIGAQTGPDDRFQEALGYFQRAAEIAPGDNRIEALGDQLRGVQAARYRLLAEKVWQHEREIWRRNSNSFYGLGSYHTEGGLGSALSYHLKALQCLPTSDRWLKDRLISLEWIENHAVDYMFEASRLYDFSVVQEALSAACKELDALLNRQDDVGKLRRLKARRRSDTTSLYDAEKQLTALRKQGGFRTKQRIADIEKQVRALKDKVAETDRKIAEYHRRIYGTQEP